MRLVFLYGPPGVGKFTVGGALAALTGFKLFHNHLTVDLVTSVFPRGSEPWGRLLRDIRRQVFVEAARQDVDLIFTSALRSANPDYVETVRTTLELVRAAGGSFLFVRLTCDRDELVARVQTDARRARGKLTDPAVVLELYDLDATLPFEPQLAVDTTPLSPSRVADLIARHFALPTLPPGERAAVDQP